jgi:hypothetical protein
VVLRDLGQQTESLVQLHDRARCPRLAELCVDLPVFGERCEAVGAGGHDGSGPWFRELRIQFGVAAHQCCAFLQALA